VPSKKKEKRAREPFRGKRWIFPIRAGLNCAVANPNCEGIIPPLVEKLKSGANEKTSLEMSRHVRAPVRWHWRHRDQPSQWWHSHACGDCFDIRRDRSCDDLLLRGCHRRAPQSGGHLGFFCIGAIGV